MKSFTKLKEELIVEQGRATITNVGHPLHGHSGKIIARHIDGTVDIKVIQHGIPTVVRVQQHHLSHIREEIEQVDEVLTQDTSMSTIEKDFQDSDAPQFKGKSKSKKHQMAVAAYLELQRKKNK